jgi:flagellar hook-associated protein 2
MIAWLKSTAANADENLQGASTMGTSVSSTGTISVGGLASGIDTNTLTDSLVALEQQKVTAITTQQQSAQLALSDLGTVSSMLSTFSTDASAVSTMADFSLFTPSSTNSAAATITGTGSGMQGNVNVGVQQLATSWEVASSPQSSAIVGLNLSGTLNISQSAASQLSTGTSTPLQVSIASTDTLQNIASKINATTGSGVTASVVTLGTGDTRLMLNGVDTGSTSFSVTESDGGNVVSGLGLQSSTTNATSNFQLKLAVGGPATATSTLGSLYTGIGANNVAGTDSISLTLPAGLNGSDGTPINATASDITGGATSDMSQVTVSQLSSWMSTKMGGDAAVNVNSSGQLVATSANGQNLSFTLAMGPNSKGTIPLGSSTSGTNWANVLQQGQSAFYTMNGVAVSSSSNQDSTTVTGATINLVGVTSSTNPPATLSLSLNTTGIQTNIQTMLTDYNNLQDYISQKTTSTDTQSTDANGLTVNKVTPGELSSDTAVGMLGQQLQTIMTMPIPSLAGKTQYNSLASIGITTDSTTGHLTINQTTFQTALTADPQGVARLFSNSAWTDNGNATVGGWTNSTQTGTYNLTPSTNTIGGSPGNRVGDILFSTKGNSNGLGVTAPTSISGSLNATFVRGIAGQIGQFISQVQDPVSGILTSDSTSIQSQITDLGKQASDQQTRVDAYRTQLQASFTAMESAMSSLKSQSSAFLSAISGSTSSSSTSTTTG